MSELPTGTLTVLHTDIENSTSLARYLREQYPAGSIHTGPCYGPRSLRMRAGKSIPREIRSS
jgi:hypothetical protein